MHSFQVCQNAPYVHCPCQKFPLSELPYLAQRCVFMFMSHGEILSYSLTSKENKQIVRTLKLRSEIITITVSDTIDIFPLPDLQISVNLSHVSMASVHNERGRKEMSLERNGFEPRDYLDHILDVYHCQDLHLDFSCDGFPREIVKKVFKGLKVSSIYIGSIRAPFYKAILEEFTNLSELSLQWYPLSDLEFQEHVLKRKLLRLSLMISVDTNIRHILNCKALNLDVWGTREITVDDLNTFFKQWTQGHGAPTMESLFIQMHCGKMGGDYLGTILEGIEYEEVADDVERRFYRSFERDGFEEDVTVFRGGVDIERMDGVRGTLKAYVDTEDDVNLHFMVWH